METGVKGVQLFRVTESLRCAPAVYEPTVVAIVNGAKEAILDGKSYVYDSSQYMCCHHVDAGGGWDTHCFARQSPSGSVKSPWIRE